MNKIILTCLVIVTIQGCTSLKRYRCAQVKKSDTQLVDMNLFSAQIKEKKDEEEGKTLWDLKGEGQAQLIKVLGDSLRVKEDAFFEALNKTYLENEEEPSALDFTCRQLQMVFSIEKIENYLKYKPCYDADRIAKIKYEITIPDSSNVKFEKWNKFETEYGDIAIGNVETNQNFEAKISPSFTTSAKVGADENNTTGAELGIAGEASAGYSKKEVQDVKYRFVKLNGVFSDKKLQMREEGTREIDLAGNVTITTDIKFEETDMYAFKASKLLDKDDAYNAPGNVKLTALTVKIPNFPRDQNLSVTLHVSYLYRRAERNSRTYPEFDDHAVYYAKDSTKTIDLIPSKDLKPKLWHITIGGKPLNTIEAGVENTITFLSFNEALAFKKWLLGFPCAAEKEDDQIKIGKYSLKTQNGAVSKKTITDNPTQVLIQIH